MQQFPSHIDGFFGDEQHHEYESQLPYHASAAAGPSGQDTTQGPPSPKKSKGKAKASPNFSHAPKEFSEDDLDTWLNQSDSDVPIPTRRRPPTPPSTPEPPRMSAPPNVSFSAPLRTSLDMPIKGSKDAPRTFKGKHTEIQPFLDHFEMLLNKYRITSDKEKCERILSYCSIEVQNVIQTLESYQHYRWGRLRKELLKHYDAERAVQKYKPSDVYAYAFKMRNKPCYSLTQWRKYYVKYNSIAGGPLNRQHLGKEDYLAYFWMGIHRPLRQILENRVLQCNPYRSDEAQYSMKELNAAAEWYFRRNKYESLMVKAVEFGEERDEDYSGEESEEASSESEDSDSDYEEFRRKKKQRAKKRKQERKKKAGAKKEVAEGKERQKYTGTEDEVASMIRKLNAMKLDDPEYAPIYYKVMVMDKSGTAKDCVKSPFPVKQERAPIRPPANSNANTTLPERPPTPATYPNNIPIGRATPTNGCDFSGCFGCLAEGHRISDCQLIADLVNKQVITYDAESRRMMMSNGRKIWRQPGESLVVAAERMHGGNAPRVMMGVLDEALDTQSAVHNFFIEETRRARIEEVYTDSSVSDEEESQGSEESEASPRVFLTKPKQARMNPPGMFPVERSVPSTRAARKEILDGVYPPSRFKAKVKDLEEKSKPEAVKPNTRSRTMSRPTEESALPVDKPPAAGAGKVTVKPPNKTNPPMTHQLPDITPVEARRVRFDASDDEEMPEIPGKSTPTKKKRDRQEKGQTGVCQVEDKIEEPKNPEEVVTAPRHGGRQSELSSTVDRQEVINRILDTPVPMTMREIMVTSKDLRNDFQDLIRVKNIRAVLLGNSQDYPSLTNLNWPRSDGILIKVDMETGGTPVCAIIDTGSQLDVVRADVAALQVKRAVDMSQITNMNDANGGRGQLQGYIQDVEFTCGGAITMTDLWVSQQAPFELLLGRPWQRGNLVSIDEREEGTYLIFKDRVSRRPRYELLAVPYEKTDISAGKTVQYQSYSVTVSHNLPEVSIQNDSGLDEEWKFYAEEVKTRSDATTTYQGGLEDSQLDFAAMTREAQFTEMSWPLPHDRADDGLRSSDADEVMSIDSRLEEDIYMLGKQKGQGAPWNTHPDAFVAMSVIPAPEAELPSPTAPTPVIPYEDIQYLSRAHTNSSSPVIAPLDHESPLLLVNAAVNRQWTNYLNKNPIDVRPTFAAAPQSEYFGAVVLPDGQVVHQSVGLNTFRVFNDEATGQPYTITGHEVILNFSSPADVQTPWKMELFLPSDDRLRHVMEAMLPPGVSLGNEPAFPVHATSHPPPLLTPAERLAQMVREQGTLDPASTFFHRPPSPVSDLTLDELPSPPSSDSGWTQLEEDINERVDTHLDALTMDGVSFAMVPTSYNPGNEGLFPAGYSDNGESASEVFPLACPTCLGSRHESTVDCPLWNTASSTTLSDSSEQLNDLAGEVSGPAHTQSIEQIYNILIGPDSASTTVHPRQNSPALTQDEEARRTLEAALNPILHDLTSLPASSLAELRSLATTAVELKRVYDEFIVALERRKLEEEDWMEVMANQEAWAQEQPSADGSDSDGSLPSLEPISPPVTPPGLPLLPHRNDNALVHEAIFRFPHPDEYRRTVSTPATRAAASWGLARLFLDRTSGLGDLPTNDDELRACIGQHFFGHGPGYSQRESVEARWLVDEAALPQLPQVASAVLELIYDRAGLPTPFVDFSGSSFAPVLPSTDARAQPRAVNPEPSCLINESDSARYLFNGSVVTNLPASVLNSASVVDTTFRIEPSAIQDDGTREPVHLHYLYTGVLHLDPVYQIFPDVPNVGDDAVHLDALASETHVSRVETPIFERGEVVTRELWSSSVPSSRSGSSSEESYTYEQFQASSADLSSGSHNRVVLSPVAFTPAVTEWVMTQHGSPSLLPAEMTPEAWDIVNERRYSPVTDYELVDDKQPMAPAPTAPPGLSSPSTVYAAIARHLPTPEPMPSSLASSQLLTDNGSFRTDITSEALRAITNPISRVATAVTREEADNQEQELLQWLQDSTGQQREHIRWEDDTAGAPLYSALRTLWGPLRELLDVPAISEADNARLDALASAALTLPPLPVPSDLPDATQAPTSLDFSLPDVRSAPASGRRSSGGYPRTRLAKRKAGEVLPNPPPARKNPADLTNGKALDMALGVRLAILAGSECAEQFVFEHYGVTEDFLPHGYIRNDLLTDFEAAKLQVLHNVLYGNHRYMLVSLIRDLLTTQFRDVFAISPLLNSGHLQTRHPGATYWELLPFADVASITGPGAMDIATDDVADLPDDSDSDSDMGGLLHYPDTDSSYYFGSESSTSYTDASGSDVDSDIESEASVHDSEASSRSPRPGSHTGTVNDKSVYINRVGDWFRGVNPEGGATGSGGEAEVRNDAALADDTPYMPESLDWQPRAIPVYIGGDD